nr:spastin-like [Rhipicephalus microplus]
MALHVTVVVFVFSGNRSARHEERHYGHLSATGGSSDAMAASSGNPSVNLLIRMKQYHKRAFNFISKALKYDELANDLYPKDIEELQKSIDNNFAQKKCPLWEWTHRLTDKMKVNLDMAKDRLDFLKSMVKIENVGDDLSWHASVARPQANEKRRGWQKAAQGHDAAPILGGPTWQKMAENCGPGGQVNDSSPPLPPRSGVMLKNQAAKASRLWTIADGSEVAATRSNQTHSSPRVYSHILQQRPDSKRSFRGGREGRRVWTLKGVGSLFAHMILDEIRDGGPEVLSRDIASQEVTKHELIEMVILPTDRPELFTSF